MIGKLRIYIFLMLLSISFPVIATDLVTDIGKYRGDTPDVLLLTKLDHVTSDFLIKKARNFLVNNNYIDPFGNTGDQTLNIFKEEIVIEEDLFASPEDSPEGSSAVNRIKGDLMSVLNGISQDLVGRLGIDQLRLSVIIKNLSYRVNEISTGMRPFSNTTDLIGFDADFRFSDIKVQADEVKIAIQKKNVEDGSYSDVVAISFDNPWLEIPKNSDLSFALKLGVNESDGKYNFRFLDNSFSDLENFIANNSKSIKSSLVPHISPSPFPLLRWNDSVWVICNDVKYLNKQIDNGKFDLTEFLNYEFGVAKSEASNTDVRILGLDYIEEHQDDIVLLMLEEAYKVLSNESTKFIKDKLESVSIVRELWIPSPRAPYDFPLYTVFNLENIVSNSHEHIILSLSGDVCTQDEMVKDGVDCKNKQVITAPVRKASRSDLEISLLEMQQTLLKGKSELVVSVSEGYVSRLVKQTYEAGTWEEALKGSPIEVNAKNPNSIFVIADKVGRNISLYMDVYAHFSFIQRLAIGKKKVRFPIKLDASIDLKNIDGVFNLVINIESVDTSEALLMKDHKKYGLYSDLKNVKRFKKMVLKEIRKELSSIKGQKIKVPADELRDMGLEHVKFQSNGLGRIVANLSIDKLLNWNPKDFYDRFINGVSRATETWGKKRKKRRNR